jgi:hypothetical protein
MKRLIVYLFIVFSLTFFFTFDSNAAICLKKDFKEGVSTIESDKCPTDYYEIDVKTSNKISSERNKLNKKLSLENKKKDWEHLSILLTKQIYEDFLISNEKIKILLCKDELQLKKYYPFLKEEWPNGECPKSTPVKISYEEYLNGVQKVCLREKQGDDTAAYLNSYNKSIKCSGIDHDLEIKFDGEDLFVEKNKYTNQLKIIKVDPKNQEKFAKTELNQKQDLVKIKNIEIANTAWILDSRFYVLFLNNGKCKINERGLDTIINNINYEGSWETFCKYKKNFDNSYELEHGNGTKLKKYFLAFFENTFIGSNAEFGLKRFQEVLNGKKPKNIYVQGIKKELTASQIAKLPNPESNQKQEVAETVSLQLNKNEVDAIFSSVNSCWSIPLGLPYDEDLSVKIKVKFDLSGNAITTEIIDFAKINKKGNAYLKVLAESALRAIKLCQPIKAPKEKYELWKEVVFNFDAKDVLNGTESSDTKIAKNNLLNKSTETQIAKAEPSQTQKVANTDIIGSDNFICVDEFQYNKENNSYTLISKGSIKDPNCVFNISKSLNPKIYNELIDYMKSKSLSGSIAKTSHISKPLFNKIKGSKIAKAEPTITPKKKKVEFAKVDEPKQEEFKPKSTNQDKDPPVIQIAETITVNNSDYTIEGIVSDKADKVFLEVDGQTIVADKGKFKIQRFSPIDEQIQIVAIDQWGNRSKPKTVNIKLDIKSTETALLIEKLNPTKIKNRTDSNKVALIIGIENYDQTPKATFANLDAKYFYEYANKSFGVPKGNIKLLVDDDANLIQSLGVLSKWLPGKIKNGKTDLIIFFAGHGLASVDGKELFLLPQDSDPDLLERTALSRNELFKNIIDLNPKSVTMFFDTCFSGISRDETTLLASARPIRIVADEQEGIPENFTIFSASQLDQISSGLKEVNHGIFSYYLMKGLEGNADQNDDKQITNGELLSYLNENVSQKASELGRQQNPTLSGNPDQILARY